jgi:hypothetical protein
VAEVIPMRSNRWKALVVVVVLGVIVTGTKSLLSGPIDSQLAEGEKLSVPAVVGMSTLVGYSRKSPPPWTSGNCFELTAGAQDRRDPAEGFHVINMHAENFKEIVKLLALKDVEVELVGGQFLVVDRRITRRWFREKPCPTCSRFGGANLTKYADKFSGPAAKP